MKVYKILQFGLFVATSLLLGCSKNKDINSLQIAKADNESIIIKGEGEPLLSIGKIGDYYLDAKNTRLYGPKTSNSWGDALSISSTSNNVKVYLKEKASISQTFTALSQDYGVYSIKLNIPNLADYDRKGLIIVQARINNGSWSDDDISIEEIINQKTYFYDVRLENGYKINGDEILIPVDISRTLEPNESANNPTIVSEVKNWMEKQKVDIKVTVINTDNFELISKKR